MKTTIYGQDKLDVEEIIDRKITDEKFVEYQEMIYENGFINKQIRSTIGDIIYWYENEKE